ncbi:MAG: CRISPR-associated protein Cas5 [Lentisphaeria bacterium]
MTDKTYEVAFEIAGPTAIFVRPDSGASFVSYPAPTYSAAVGMFAAVARLETAYLRPTHVHVCRPLRYHNYTTNYNGPLRKSKQIKDGTPYQLPTVVLADVCYQVFGIVAELGSPPLNNKGKKFNHAHYLQDKFNRRLGKGVLFHTPVLGWKEFPPDYFGPLRPETQPDASINEFIPAMLMETFDKPSHGSWNPQFKPVWIRNGVMRYAQ